jgi:hypothetical protein
MKINVNKLKQALKVKKKKRGYLHKEGLQWKIQEVPLLLLDLVFYSFPF